MKIAISSQDVDSSKAEATAAGGTAHATRGGRERRRRRWWSTRSTARAEINNVRRFHQDRQRVRAAGPVRRWSVEVFLPHHGSELGVDRVDSVSAAPNHEIFESLRVDQSRSKEGFAERRGLLRFVLQLDFPEKLELSGNRVFRELGFGLLPTAVFRVVVGEWPIAGRLTVSLRQV
jgi:hypothetical protein